MIQETEYRTSVAAAGLVAVLIATTVRSPAVWGVEESVAARADTLWKEGATLYLDKRYEASVDRYEQALSLEPSARTLTYLARSLKELDRYDEAIEQSRKAIEIDPDYPDAYGVLGAYLVDLERPAEAIPPLRKAAGLPDYCCPHFAYYQLARAHLMQGEVDEAVKALRTAVNINPRYRQALKLLDRIRSGNYKSL